MGFPIGLLVVTTRDTSGLPPNLRILRDFLDKGKAHGHSLPTELLMASWAF